MTTIAEETWQKTQYAGKYMGIVQDINDPLQRRRVKVLCPEITEIEPLTWAEPCGTMTEWLPQIGDILWIELRQGYHIEYPIWTGLAVAKADVSQEFIANYNSNYRRDRDYNGNSIEWSPSGIKFEDLNGNKIIMDATGIKFEDKNGNVVYMQSGKISFNGINHEVLT